MSINIIVNTDKEIAIFVPEIGAKIISVCMVKNELIFTTVEKEVVIFTIDTKINELIRNKNKVLILEYDEETSDIKTEKYYNIIY